MAEPRVRGGWGHRRSRLSVQLPPPTGRWNPDTDQDGWSGGAEGPGRPLRFPPTESQKWQEVKAHQRVKTLVIIKTCFFLLMSLLLGKGLGAD